MICYACVRGAEFNTRKKYTLARVSHEECIGCSCHHYTGEGWIKKKAPRVNAQGSRLVVR